MDNCHDHSLRLKGSQYLRAKQHFNGHINSYTTPYTENKHYVTGCRQLPIIIEEKPTTINSTPPLLAGKQYSSSLGYQNQKLGSGNNRQVNTGQSRNIPKHQYSYSVSPQLANPRPSKIQQQVRSSLINCSQLPIGVSQQQVKGSQNSYIQPIRAVSSLQIRNNQSNCFQPPNSAIQRQVRSNQNVSYQPSRQTICRSKPIIAANQSSQMARNMNANLNSRYTSPGAYTAPAQQLPVSPNPSQAYPNSTPNNMMRQLRANTQSPNLQANVFVQRNEVEPNIEPIITRPDYHSGQIYQKENQQAGYLEEQVGGNRHTNYQPEEIPPNATDIAYYPFHRDLLNATGESDLYQNYSVKLPTGVVHQYPIPDYVDNSSEYSDIPPNYELRLDSSINDGSEYTNDSNECYSVNPAANIPSNHIYQNNLPNQPQLNLKQQQQQQLHLKQQHKQQPHVQQQHIQQQHVQQQQVQQQQLQQQQVQQHVQQQHLQQQHIQRQQVHQQQVQQQQIHQQQMQPQQLFRMQNSSSDILANQYGQVLTQLPMKQENYPNFIPHPETQQVQSGENQEFTRHRSSPQQESPQGSPMPNQQTSPGVFKTPQATPPLARKQIPVRQISNEIYKLDSPSSALLLQDMSLNSPRPRSETFEMEAPPLPPRSPLPKQVEQYVDLTQFPHSPPSPSQPGLPSTPTSSYDSNQPTNGAYQAKHPNQYVDNPQPQENNMLQQLPDVNRRLRSGTVEMIDSPPLSNPKQDAQSKQLMPPPTITTMYRHTMSSNNSPSSSVSSPMQRSRAGTVEMADTSQTTISYEDSSPPSGTEQRIRSGTVEMSDTPLMQHRQLPSSQQSSPVAQSAPHLEQQSPQNQRRQDHTHNLQNFQQTAQQQPIPLQAVQQNQQNQQPQMLQSMPQQQLYQQPSYQVKVQVPISIKNEIRYTSRSPACNERGDMVKPPPPYPDRSIKPESDQNRAIENKAPTSSQGAISHHQSTADSYPNQIHQQTGQESSCHNKKTVNSEATEQKYHQSAISPISQHPHSITQSSASDNRHFPASTTQTSHSDVVTSQYVHQDSNKFGNAKRDLTSQPDAAINQLSDQELDRQQKIMQQQYVQRVRQVQLQQQLRELQNQYETNLAIEQDIAQEFLREQNEMSLKRTSSAGNQSLALQLPQYQQSSPMANRPHPQCPPQQVNVPYIPPGQQMMAPRSPYNTKDPVFPVTGLPISQQVYHQKQASVPRPAQNPPIVIMPGGGSFSNPGQFNPMLSTPVKKQGHLSESGSNVTAKPQTPFQKLRKIAEDISSFVDDVVKFKGEKGGEEYKCLEEMLTQQLLLLDKVAANSNDELRSARKALVKEVQELLEILEKRATGSQVS